MLNYFMRIFGSQQSRLLKKYQKIVQQVNREEVRLASLSDAELKGKTAEFRERLAKESSLDLLLPEAYAVVKLVCRRLCGLDIAVSGYRQKWDMVPYDVQILGAIALHHGSIAEMQTGEGKTLTACMPLYLNALQGPAHLVTVNDYLAQRDCEWIGVIFRWLGLRVEALTQKTPPLLRKKIYEADIVYGTASEFGFDYLRDHSMAQSQEEQCQRELHFGLIDEVDSTLIDEARTPLIISGPATETRHMYQQLQKPVAQLIRVQRDLCNKLGTEAKKTLEQLQQRKEFEGKKFSKIEEKEEGEAFRKLWLVGKGMPHNKILKKIKEEPDLRAKIDKWDVYYYAEANKEEKIQSLAELYLIIDERGSEYELTDKGIQLWGEMGGSADDFLMLDLGFEYAKIDQEERVDEEAKFSKKIALREEDRNRKEKIHNVRQLLRAHLLMEKDVDYIVTEGKVIIIDENTGRPQPGRRFADGLHPAIEAKEGVAIQGETQTYATITLQNYFRLYKKIAGMTGTAITEAQEFKEIYRLDVLVIPPHLPCQRKDAHDEIYMTEREKYAAILKEVKEVHEQGRPILIGTESVDVSEKLSRILKQNKLEHTVLNAKNHPKEAEIIELAGREGAITIATPMAGRGTDIKIHPEIANIGGLHVMGTTRHQSRRIDRQLRGRTARQGDPGSSKFYISFEDSLLRLFASPRTTSFLQRFRPPEGEPISASILNKSIETAQKRVEQKNYQIRKHTLEYDDIMNKQRIEVYSFRNELLRKNPLKIAEEVIEGFCLKMSSKFLVDQTVEGGWDLEGYRQWLMSHFPITFEIQEFDDDYGHSEDIEHRVLEKVIATFRSKIAQEAVAVEKAMEHLALPHREGEHLVKQVVRNILIRKIDSLWQEYLLDIDHLKTEVHLRVVGQKDPLMEFKHESFALFDAFTTKLKEEIIHHLFKFQVLLPPPTIDSLDYRAPSVGREFKTDLSQLFEVKPQKSS